MIFTIVNKPSLPNFDAATGALTGTPTKQDAGAADVEIVVRRTYPHERLSGGNQWADKSARRFQASHRRKFRITVAPR